MATVLSHTEYRTIVEHAPIMIRRTNRFAQCDFFNERWLTFTGRQVEEETGDGWLAGVYADDRERCIQTLLDAFKQREPFELQYRLRRFDGEYRWIHDKGGPFVDAAGEFAGYIASCVDVTDSVLARAALARSNLKDLGLG